MKRVYLDNGATSYPKAPGVAESMVDYIINNGANIGRGTYESSFHAENVVFETREKLAKLFHFPEPANVIFTKNITESLNVLLKGLLKENDHVIVSSMEHNAVMRPLNSLGKRGVTFSKVQCNNVGELDPEDILKQINTQTRAVVMTHASNVCGTIIDLENVGKLCKEQGLLFIVDAAQTAGFIDVDFFRIKADAIAFTGHKSLLGPQGMGGFVISEELSNEIDTLVEGGTGSLSDKEIQPEYMPDKLEAGTQNIPGIFGLHAALEYLEKNGVDNLRKREMMQVEAFIDGLMKISGVKLIGKSGIEGRTGVVSIDVPERDNADISFRLYDQFGIATRCGMHCAPSAHKTLGTFPQGTVRFSFSHFNTMEEVEYTLGAIRKVVR
ncbi:aminotransferase class V-fold PLP-dependent enzyme [Gudongella sp. DL1XJH-153]|uniref:aminotransferase class V-fold PLP-dependent enzyme n=1 Tax=Gudongella sp. DL1XJH-153 TaxID=3409804 RepID=UPI003BB7D829